MHNRCIVFKGASQYDSMRCFADELCDAFNGFGCEAVVFDLLQEQSLGDLIEVIRGGVDFILSFNAVGIDIEYGGKPLCDYMGLPFIALMVDSPIHHHERISAPIANVLFTFIDKEHVLDVKTRFPNKNCIFFPHGGSGAKNRKMMKDRAIDILFSGSYSNIADETKKELAEMNSPVITNLYNRLLDSMLKDSKISYRTALTKLTKRQPRADEWEDLTPLLCKAESAYRVIIRENILETLLKAGATVTCIGHGWESSPLMKYNNFIHRHFLGYNDAIELMGDTKICINCSPMFKNGSHERVFSSMLSGAVCLSDENIFLKELFTDGEDILFYNPSQLEAMPDRVLKMLNDTSSLTSVSERAYEKAAAGHKWKNRARGILDIVGGIYGD